MRGSGEDMPCGKRASWWVVGLPRLSCNCPYEKRKKEAAMKTLPFLRINTLLFIAMHFFIIIAPAQKRLSQAVFSTPSRTFFQSSADTQKQTSSGGYKRYELLFGSVGYETLFGNITKTLSSGVRFSICEFSTNFARGQEWLWFGIAPLNFAFNEYNETRAELDTLRYFTKKAREGSVYWYESVDNVSSWRYQFSVNARLLPAPEGLVVSQAGNKLFPFVRCGFSYHYIGMSQDVSESQSWSGFNPFLAVGFAMTVGNDDDKPWFIQLEVLYERLPPWDVKFLRVLRPIEGGRSLLLRIGFGVLGKKNYRK
jgi:hypothetical protein